MAPTDLKSASAGSALAINSTVSCSVNVTMPVLLNLPITKGIDHDNMPVKTILTTCHDIQVNMSSDATGASESSCHEVMYISPSLSHHVATVCHPHSISRDEVDHVILDNYYNDVLNDAQESSDGSSLNSTSTILVPRDTAAVPNDIAKLAVDTHNKVRAKHGAQPLRWNSDLASYAQTVANDCSLGHNVAVGSETGKYGQSIASWGTNGVEHRSIDELVVDGIAVQWYSGEIDKYPGYGREPPMDNFPAWGHFSQTLWGETTEVGCAIQSCPAEKSPLHIPGMSAHLMYCNYRTAGNVQGKYAENVKPPVA